MKITLKEFVEQIKIVLRDEFVADVQAKGNKVTLIFKNGQKFQLTLKKSYSFCEQLIKAVSVHGFYCGEKKKGVKLFYAP